MPPVSAGADTMFPALCPWCLYLPPINLLLQDDGNPHKEQEEWERHQMGHATAQYGSKAGRKDVPKDYEFVFEDQLDFIKTSMLAGDAVGDAEEARSCLLTRSFAAGHALAEIASAAC